MSRFLLGTLTAALLFATLNLQTPALAVESAGLPPQNTITMNFQNVDIPVLAKFISEITGRNFIIDESRARQGYDHLAEQGHSRAGLFDLPIGAAGEGLHHRSGRQDHQDCARAQHPLDRPRLPLADSRRDQGDEYVTRMVRLKNIDAASMIGVIQPMVSHDGLVAAFPRITPLSSPTMRTTSSDCSR